MNFALNEHFFDETPSGGNVVRSGAVHVALDFASPAPNTTPGAPARQPRNECCGCEAW
jgi:hypothetical protein